jgi:hypothetical protein
MLDFRDLAGLRQKLVEMAARHCAGFGTDRSPANVAELKTRSIRPRSLEAVSDLTPHSGAKACMTSAVSILSIGILPKIGDA